MNTAFDPHLKKHASVYANANFICVESCAGYRRSGDERLVAFLPRSAISEVVGAAVLEALNAYRVLAETEIAEFFSIPHVDERNKAWEIDLMQRAGYKNMKELYRGLMHVPVRVEGPELVVRATRKDRRNGWEGGEIFFSIDADLGSTAIGEVVKSALAKCE